MKMVRKGDFVWGAILALWILMLAIDTSRTVFIAVTGAYAGGFLKFFILASMGDLLGYRIRNGAWVFPRFFLGKAVVWGLLGMAITLMFNVFMGGVAFAQETGYLPFAGSTVAQAFFGSVTMNLTFGPMLYIYHKFGDLLIDGCLGQNRRKTSLKEMVDSVDWHTMVGFSWIKTCLLVWIPCHTVVFLLPAEYRVLASAFLSILLGVLIAISKKKDTRLPAV